MTSPRLLLTAIFVASRVLLALTSPLTVSTEAGYFGEAIRDVLGPFRFAPLEYQYSHYEGGSLLTIFLGLPFVALFGNRFWALNLQGILASAILFFLAVEWIERTVGRRQAIFAGLALLCCPPFLAVESAMATWGVMETALFGLLYLRLVSALEPGVGLSTGRRAALGLVAGLGFWSHYTFIAALFAPCLMGRRWLSAYARQLASGAFVAGLIAGLTPWLAYNAANDWMGLAHLEAGAPVGLSQAAGRLAELVTFQVPLSFGFPGPEPLARALAWTCWGTMLAAAVLTGRQAPGAGRLLLGHAVAYLVLASASGYQVLFHTETGDVPPWGHFSNWRYTRLLPLHPTLCLLVGLAGERLARLYFAVCLAGLLLLPSAAGKGPGPADPAAVPGRFAIEQGWRNGYNPAKALLVREKLDARERLAFAIGLGYAAAESRHVLRPYLEALPPEERTGVWMGLGRKAAMEPSTGARLEDFLAAVPEEARLAVKAGLLMTWVTGPWGERPPPGGDLFASLGDSVSSLGPAAQEVRRAWREGLPFWW